MVILNNSQNDINFLWEKIASKNEFSKMLSKNNNYSEKRYTQIQNCSNNRYFQKYKSENRDTASQENSLIEPTNMQNEI